MSAWSEFWAWSEAKREREEDRIWKAKLLRKLRITEGSLVSKPANEHCKILIAKGHGSEDGPMDDLEEYLRGLEPKLSYGAALAKHAGDPVVAGLYEIAKHAEPEPVAEIAKAAQPGDEIWSEIEDQARMIRKAAGNAVTMAEAIEQACVKHPHLYDRYRDATME